MQPLFHGLSLPIRRNPTFNTRSAGGVDPIPRCLRHGDPFYLRNLLRVGGPPVVDIFEIAEGWDAEGHVPERIVYAENDRNHCAVLFAKFGTGFGNGMVRRGNDVRRVAHQVQQAGKGHLPFAAPPEGGELPESRM